MISLGGFIIRDAAAAVLFAMALGKIITPRMAATQAWRPSWVPSGLALAAIFTLAITEMLLSIAVLLAPAPRWIVAVPVAIFFGLVTSYGLTAIARTGSCGCGGIAAAQIRKSALIRRNALICSASIAGTILGPSLHALEAHGARYALGESVVPLGGFAILVALRAVQAKRLAHGSRRYPPSGKPGSQPANSRPGTLNPSPAITSAQAMNSSA